MKIIISTLLLCTLALCEVPPPYYQSGFRPSPQFISQSRYPQTSSLTRPLDLSIPSKLTIEQLIALTERLQSSRGRITNRPQRIEVSSYLPPPREPQQNRLQINQLRPPPASFSQPQNQYGPPQSSSFRPNKLQNTQPNLNVASSSQQSTPQTSYGVPTNQLPPSTNYGVPDFRNVETFGEQQNFLNGLKKQHLPYKAPTGFIPQENKIGQSINQQYLPASGGSNVGQQPQSGFGGNQTPQTESGSAYLPPQTTPRSVFTSRATTSRPSTVATTSAGVDGSTNYDYDYDVQQTTENPLNQEGSEAGPNISISTAVAGANNGFFYLQQPDGRLQKVVLQKMKEPNSKPEEYVANYYFQNIQALPNTAYTPLISLGTYAQK